MNQLWVLSHLFALCFDFQRYFLSFYVDVGNVNDSTMSVIMAASILIALVFPENLIKERWNQSRSQGLLIDSFVS